MAFRKGDSVERELEGCWFPATVTSVNADGTFDVFYTDDGNDEEGVEECELRYSTEESKEEEKIGDASAGERSMAAIAAARRAAEGKGEEEMERAPTVVVHGKGNRDRAASAYIINGVETNVAVGRGIRGIRWLRQNADAVS